MSNQPNKTTASKYYWEVPALVEMAITDMEMLYWEDETLEPIDAFTKWIEELNGVRSVGAYGRLVALVKNINKEWVNYSDLELVDSFGKDRLPLPLAPSKKWFKNVLRKDKEKRKEETARMRLQEEYSPTAISRLTKKYLSVGKCEL